MNLAGFVKCTMKLTQMNFTFVPLDEGYVAGMEVSSVSQRSHITLLQCVGWTAGLCLTPLVAWVVGGHWQIFTLLTTLPCAAVFLAFRLVS
jgi:hypothetical protein